MSEVGILTLAHGRPKYIGAGEIARSFHSLQDKRHPTAVATDFDQASSERRTACSIS